MTIENKYMLCIKKHMRAHFPGLLSKAAGIYYRNFKFEKEKMYIKGQLSSELDAPSLLLLSCNRAATQLVEDVLSRIYCSGGGCHIALNKYLFFSKDDSIPFLDADYMLGLMQARGYFFDYFDRYKLVVMCRDPRDLLVSHFYSFTKAHVPRNKEFIEKMSVAKEMGIQKYVLEEEHINYFKTCLEQAVKLKDKENVLFCKYEDMMDDFDSFQSDCQQFINGEINSKLSEELNALHQPAVITEQADHRRHRRSGAWGQFKKVLDPEVIEQLNMIFGELLQELEYEL